jgi:glycosyltransferase involved in cell wall biosynthesis
LKELRKIIKHPKLTLYHLRVVLYIWCTYKFGIKQARRVITVSDYSARDIVKTLNISPDKVTAIHHGLDIEFTHAGAGLANGSDYIDGVHSRKNVLMLGGDSYQKNPEGAIAAWAKVPESLRSKNPLKIIGFCGNEQSPLLQAIRAHGLAEEVEVKGWVSQEELITYLRNAALFLYLSRYEGFGFPLLHAMASGTPVVSTNKSSLPEVLGEVGFKVEPDDSSGAAKAIERVLLDSKLWHEQVAAGIERSHMFSWKQSAEKHLSVYEEVLEAERGTLF